MTKCWIATVCLLVLVVPTACDTSKDGNDIIICADPPSIYRGQTMNISLTANDNFDFGKVETPYESSGGLTLKKIKKTGKKTAIATVESIEGTVVGIHRIELASREYLGKVVLSVLVPESGPGDIQAVGNMGSAGAKFAYFTVLGEGTSFDRHCTVEVENADGLSIKLVNVVNGQKMEIFYSIDMDQKKGAANIVIIDGEYRYELPFEIIQHEVCENLLTDQVFTRGQVGNLRLFNPACPAGQSASLIEEEDFLQVGVATIGEDKEAIIPIRISDDYEEENLEMSFDTFYEGGSILSIMNTLVSVKNPAYFVILDANIGNKSGEIDKVFVVEGFSTLEIASIYFKDEDVGLKIVDWRSENNNMGSLTMLSKNTAEAGVYSVVVKLLDGREIMGLITKLDEFERVVAAPNIVLYKGDRLFVPIMINGGVLPEKPKLVYNDEQISVNDLIFYDDNIVVVDIAVNEDSSGDSLDLIFEDSSHYQYKLCLPVYDSKI